MEIIRLKIAELTPYEGNAKLHPKEQIAQIINSIKQFGFCDPVGIWSEKNIIVEGHGRVLALQEMGETEVDCIRLDHLTDEERKAYTLAHNKTTMSSDFDLDKLEAELKALGEMDLDFSMEDFGFDLAEFDEPQDVVEDEVPEVDEESEPITQLGDIWQLGEHRLMCGSSTDENDVARLMNGNVAKMLFTSPPYSDMREYNGDKNLEVCHIAKFIEKYKPYTNYQCVNLGIQRKDHEIISYWDEYIKIARNCGYKLMAWNVWDKLMCGSVGQQSAFFPIRHEWVFVFGTQFFEINQTFEKKDVSINITRPRLVRQRDGSTKYSSRGDTSNKFKQMESVLPLHAELGAIRALHPATFPVGLPSEYIQAMTDKGDNVIEPFCGSGTTLIACEQIGRKCFGMELDPKYCDVIIKRWETLTGNKAVKL